jgi:glycosyltransferase involved in cell wall biosynthesis
MRLVFRAAKSVYYFLFLRLAHFCLSRHAYQARLVPNPPKINLVCRFGIQNGLTNGANYHFLALETLGYSVRKVDITPAIKNPFGKIECETDAIFIFHCAAPQFLQFAWPLRSAIKGRKLIGYFAWELAEPPTDWPNYRDVWDEIWTTSSFSAQSLVTLYDCPIRVVPHVLLKEGRSRVWRKGAERLTFLTMADARSSLMRKNPAGTVAAFRKAFPTETDVELIVKLQINARTPEVEKLLALVADDKRITVMLDSITRDEVDALFEKAHAYISLHRAEGFGLPLLEARVAGLATIATAWSGNMDFMTAEDSVLIPYDLVKMLDEGGIYGEVTWADPDLNAASTAMRRFYYDPDYLSRIGTAGRVASSSEKQLARFADAVKSLHIV